MNYKGEGNEGHLRKVEVEILRRETHIMIFHNYLWVYLTKKTALSQCM